jgi:cation diffusion facilitator family transporter
MTNEHRQGHQHTHIYLSADHDKNARRTQWVVLLTAIMMVAEIVAGYVTGSMALLADGFHMATHAGALTIAAVAYGFAKRNATNASFSFGTGKVGDLAGFASALILGIVSIGIAVESGLRFIQPVNVAFDEAILVAVLGLLVNIVSAVMLSGGGHAHDHAHGHDHHDHHHGHTHGQDNNLRSAYVHVLADALTSLLAIVALLAGRYYGLMWLDPLMGIVGAIVIAKWSYSLMKSTAHILLDKTDEHVAQEIKAVIATFNGVQMTDLHVWQVGPAARAAIVSIASIHAEVGEQIRERLAYIEELVHLTVEVHQ